MTRRALLGVVLLLSLSHIADATPTPTPPRTLRGHVFIPSQIVADPFTATYFDSTTGFGYATATGPRYDLSGVPVGTRPYDLGVLEQSFQLQVGLLSFWSVRIGTDGLIYSGVNDVAALAIGGTLQYRIRGGTTLGFTVGRHVRLAVLFDVDHGPAYNINVVGGIVGSIRAGRIDPSSLITPTRMTTLAPGLSGALGISRTVGYVVTLQYLHPSQDADEVAVTDGGVALGAIVDVDLAPVTPFPIGAAGSYRLVVPIDHEQEFLAHSIDLALVYTGRVNLVLGVEASLRWFDLAVGPPRVRGLLDDGDVHTFAVLGDLVMRYYW